MHGRMLAFLGKVKHVRRSQWRNAARVFGGQHPNQKSQHGCWLKKLPSWDLLLLFFLCSFLHFAFSHLDGYYVDLVLRSIHVGPERYIMPFVTLQSLRIGDRPALVVLVYERLCIAAHFA